MKRPAIRCLIAWWTLSLSAPGLWAQQEKPAVPVDPAAAERAGAAKAKAEQAKERAAESARLRGDLESAVKQLTAEAKELDQFEDPKVTAVFTRPHPALTDIGGDYADEVLSRMARPFTGNEYRDTYIRWHLIDVVKRAPEGEMRKSGQKIIAIINQMPDALQADMKDEWRAEPEEIWREYSRLWSQTRTVVGYPPFERVYWAREALKYMTPDRVKQMEPVVKQMEDLRKKFKTITDRQAIKYNDRIRQVNWIVRQYRGELIYALLMTGDSSMLEKVVSEVGKRVKLKDRAAIDITSFIYLAAFDGVLSRYGQPDLQRIGKGLEAVAKSAESYERYTNGKFEPPPWAPRNVYRFSDYVFHLVKMLEEGPQLFLGPPAQTQAMRSDKP